MGQESPPKTRFGSSGILSELGNLGFLDMKYDLLVSDHGNVQCWIDVTILCPFMRAIDKWI